MKKFKNLFIVSIAGNIAAGKTSLLNALQNRILNGANPDNRVVFIPEPHTIAGTESHTLAPEYFEAHKLADETAKEKINLDFQFSVLTDLHAILDAENKAAEGKNPTLVILERGWADVLVFSAVNFGRNSRNYELLKEQIRVLFDRFADLTLYLPIRPDIALARAEKRAQNEAHEKQSVTKYGTLEFFKAIDAEYGTLASIIPKNQISVIEQAGTKQLNVISYIIAHAYAIGTTTANDAQK